MESWWKKDRILPLRNFELKLRIPLTWYMPDPMHATQSRFEVPQQNFEGIWNPTFSKKKVRFGLKTLVWALDWSSGPDPGM